MSERVSGLVSVRNTLNLPESHDSNTRHECHIKYADNESVAKPQNLSENEESNQHKYN